MSSQTMIKLEAVYFACLNIYFAIQVDSLSSGKHQALFLYFRIHPQAFLYFRTLPLTLGQFFSCLVMYLIESFRLPQVKISNYQAWNCIFNERTILSCWRMSQNTSFCQIQGNNACWLEVQEVYCCWTPFFYQESTLSDSSLHSSSYNLVALFYFFLEVLVRVPGCSYYQFQFFQNNQRQYTIGDEECCLFCMLGIKKINLIFTRIKQINIKQQLIQELKKQKNGADFLYIRSARNLLLHAIEDIQSLFMEFNFIAVFINAGCDCLLDKSISLSRLSYL